MNFVNANRNARAGLLTAVALACISFKANIAFAADETIEWLALERNFDATRNEIVAVAKRAFSEHLTPSLSKSKDLRMMIDGTEKERTNEVEELITSVEMDADLWLATLPKINLARSGNKNNLAAQLIENSSRAECYFEATSGLYECATMTLATSAFSKSTSSPQIMIIAPLPETSYHEPEALKSLRLSDSGSIDVSELTNTHPADKSTKLEGQIPNFRKLFRGVSGVVTTDHGKVIIDGPGQAVKLVLAAEVERGHVSMFIRDPAIALVNQQKNTITAVQSGVTELFVVSRDRISIIPILVNSTNVEVASKGREAKESQERRSGEPKNISNLDVPSKLASLETLDDAASDLRASYSQQEGDSFRQVKEVVPEMENFSVPQTLTETDSSTGSSTSFSHAKTKTSFQKIFVRLMDERSSWDLSQVFPVGGLRVKILGTSFEARSDGQGYLEIPDVPLGGRLLAEIIDDSGATMPSFAEISVDGLSSVKVSAQTVMVRRYLSWDYSARLAGLVQNMEHASFCGSVLNTSVRRAPLKGVRVATDNPATGPFYFNNSGYLDTRLNATENNGRFCFFNVDPGPMSIGITSKNPLEAESTNSAVVVMTAPGRHTEEFFALDDARHITTSIASVPTAGEQLSSDGERANKYIAVDYAEVAPIGYRDAMVPIDDGVYTSATPLVPLRGRVWTVSNSGDYEASVQASSIRLPGARQITSLLPRGFVDDMMNYSQTTHDLNQGVMVVEHAMVGGQGADAVKIRLVDVRGLDAGDGWYFADNPIAKAVFFNVPPGVYSVLVETSTGHWIAADTAIAYAETSTFVRTGAPLEKHTAQVSAQN
ncbi:MAG: hypothetical protein NTV34_14180 [Proteobacteria bacterium]|nr:hypothetical protein [Pseudomonadota bacterium]